MEFKVIYTEIKSWFRFRHDAFALWRGTVHRLHDYFDILNSLDSYMQFTMDVGGNALHFLDLHITISNNRLETPACV